MKNKRTIAIRGMKIAPSVFLSAAKEVHYPFVDKTRTMTGRVSENI